uniref:Uncharacterized protein n=1 Tax=Caenorhabditis japonica TaxID=281687 RepID=A0A8R1DYE8_CAEJA
MSSSKCGLGPLVEEEPNVESQPIASSASATTTPVLQRLQRQRKISEEASRPCQIRATPSKSTDGASIANNHRSSSRKTVRRRTSSLAQPDGLSVLNTYTRSDQTAVTTRTF